MLYGNVGIGLICDAPSHPRRTESSATLLRKSQNLNCLYITFGIVYFMDFVSHLMLKLIIVTNMGKGKGNVLPRTDHEGPEWEQMYSSALPSTSTLDGWGVNVTPRPLYPRERHSTPYTEGWVSPRAGLDGCGKSRSYKDSISGLSSL